ETHAVTFDGGGFSSQEYGNVLCGQDSTAAWLTHNYYHADGNGNITALETIDEQLSATYRYDPFGNTTYSSGGMAGINTYRFSSKEITLAGYYFGERFYVPEPHRWGNRDPIGDA